MKQRALFPVGGETLARRSDPPTSKAMAAELRGSAMLGALQRRTLSLIRQEPGQTQNEYTEMSGLRHEVITPRFAELRRNGYIEPGEKRACRVTGRKCLTWWPVKEGA